VGRPDAANTELLQDPVVFGLDSALAGLSTEGALLAVLAVSLFLGSGTRATRIILQR